MRLIAVTFFFLLGVQTAHAQFANKSLGLSVGYVDLNDADALDNAIPIGLMGSIYIENGFDAVLHADLMLVRDQISGNLILGWNLAPGIRYLFLEEQIRPYVGVDLSFFGLFRPAAYQQYFGLGPNVGIDFFVSDSVSLGARAVANVYLTLNRPAQLSVGGQFVAATYF